MVSMDWGGLHCRSIYFIGCSLHKTRCEITLSLLQTMDSALPDSNSVAYGDSFGMGTILGTALGKR